MRTVTLEVRSLQDSLRRAGDAMKRGTAEKSAHIAFATPELLWDVLTAKRWEILKALAGSEAISIREIARRVHRDVKAVHADVHALLGPGVVDRTDDGKIVFPYEEVHVEFTLHAAA